MLPRILTAIGSAALMTLAPVVLAGGRQRVLAVSAPREALAIVFVDSPANVVEAGTIVWRGGSKRSVITTRRVTMRLGDAARESRGTATLRAHLETPDPRATIRINGIPIGTAPRIVQSNAPIGLPFVHRIEIEVPTTAAEGPLQATIAWEATSN